LWQDYNQIEHIYGSNQAANIFANSKFKVFMPSGQPLATCRMLQELLGKYQYETDNGVTKTRELLTAQEIFQLKEILLLNGNNKPLLLKPLPYFLNSTLKGYAELPLYADPIAATQCIPEYLDFA
jgi:type IV secretory pathway TraG/TraD family ATPase VirD4